MVKISLNVPESYTIFSQLIKKSSNLRMPGQILFAAFKYTIIINLMYSCCYEKVIMIY